MMQRENQAVEEKQLEQPDLELQLKVWKELAISKQVLMQTATKALGLKEECSTEELEEALQTTLSRAKSAESELATEKEKAQSEIEALQQQLKDSEQAHSDEIAAKDEALNGRDAAEQRLAAGKSANADELKKIKAQLATKQKEIKQITKVLADTPENVVKKMKGLKKEKMDESNARKRAEEVSRGLRKDKQRVEQKLTESKAVVKQAAELVESFRELQKLANEQYNQLAENAEDKDALTVVPAIDEELLEAIEKAAEDKDSKEKDSKEK